MTELWQKHIVPALTHPVIALHAVFFLVIYLGLARMITGLIAERRGELVADFRLLTSDIALLGFVVAFLAGAMAVIYRLNGRERSVAAENETLQQRTRRLLNDPFFLLDAGIYVTALFGLLTAVLLMVEVNGFGPAFVWTLWTTQVFYTLAGVLILIAVRAVVQHVGRQAPSGAAEDVPETPAAAPATATEVTSVAAPVKGPGFAERMVAHVATWQLQLRYGTVGLAYLGLIAFVLQMWGARNLPAGFIWSTFFFQLALVAVVAGFVLLLTRLAEVMARTRAGGGEAGSAQSPVQQFVATIHQPYGATVIVLAAIAALTGAWGLITIWSARNAPVVTFWNVVTSTTFTVVAVVAVPLVLLSVWYAVSGRKGGAQAVPSLLTDPYRLLTIVIYALAYLGLANFVFHMWTLRGIAESRIWDAAADDLFNTVVVAGVFVAMRAVVAGAVMARRGRAANP